MRLAIDTARKGIRRGQSPFGAIIVRKSRVIVRAHNAVWLTVDSTAHAEVRAIRAACRHLRTIDLSGCTIYSTCEPCPMCFAACHWARLDAVVYGASIADAARCGFSELDVSNEEMKRKGGSRIRIVPGVLRKECQELFRTWAGRADRRPY